MSTQNPAGDQPFPGLTRMRMTMGMQCNVRCTMCYQTDFSPKFNMDPVVYRERLREVYPQLRRVKIIGGEPTIMKNCREAATILRDYEKAKLIVTTNGIFVDDFWHETFIKQGNLIEVSINAATEAAYNKIVILGVYSKVIKNLERMLANRGSAGSPQIHITAVVLKDNVFELAKMIQLGADLGVDHVGFITDPILSYAGFPAYKDIRPELAAARSVQEKTGMSVSGLDGFEGLFNSDHASRIWLPEGGKKKMCAMPFNNIAVDWNADVRVCGNTWVKLGNLYKSSLTEIWNGKVAQQYRQKMRNNNYMWCSPTCEDNANPTRLALAFKYAYRINEDPKQFARKVRQKAQQLMGTWVKVKPKKKPATAAPAAAPTASAPVTIQPAKPAGMLPVIQPAQPVGVSTCGSSCGDD